MQVLFAHNPALIHDKRNTAHNVKTQLGCSVSLEPADQCDNALLSCKNQIKSNQIKHFWIPASTPVQLTDHLLPVASWKALPGKWHTLV